MNLGLLRMSKTEQELSLGKQDRSGRPQDNSRMEIAVAGCTANDGFTERDLFRMNSSHRTV
ncbi:hypothetical protein BFC17_21660 [Alteromonas lipolytica]|uniref:Uncharacterized protein n=1 Tax=Alteromonas lipolytica TaxID=1856405 RepID=A0A1E8FF87_9ALTE|nr:hypothetical protein BFC17_21660 [Alteromonas lipolytica]